MRRLAAPLLLVALAGCADPVSVRPGAASGSPTLPATPVTATPGTGSYAADAVVLRVTYEGGLVPRYLAALLPVWTLYGDGRVVTPGPRIDIYPSPAWPNVQVQKVSPATVDRIVAEARGAGVDDVDRDYGTPRVMDAQFTVFRLTTESGTVVRKVYALDLGGDTMTSATGDAAAARAMLTNLLGHLYDLDGWLGAGTATPVATYDATTVAVLARTYMRSPGEQVTEEKVAWRGPDPAKGAETRAGRCTLLTGAALAGVVDDLKRSNVLTRWETGGGDWAFTIRPLLPGERTCQDVAGSQ